jgi:hypothetical protein
MTPCKFCSYFRDELRAARRDGNEAKERMAWRLWSYHRLATCENRKLARQRKLLLAMRVEAI